MTAPTSALQGFSPATRDWFAGAFAAPTAAQEGAWAAAAGRQARAGRRPHRVRQDPGRVPVGARPAGVRARRPRRRSTGCRVLYVSPLKALAVDVQRNLRSPLAGIRQAAHRLGLPVPTSRWHAHRRHPRRRAAPVRPHPARRAGHHAGVAVPAAHVGRAGVAAGRHHGDPRRGARRRGHEARRPPRALARAARRAAGRARAAHRPLGHRAAARRGVHLPRRRPPGRGRAAAHPQDGAGVGRGAGARSRRAGRAARARQLRRGGDRLGGGRRAAAVDLARRGAAAPRAGARPPVDDRVRQLPASRRAAHLEAQRARRGGGGGRLRSWTSSRPRRSGSPASAAGAASRPWRKPTTGRCRGSSAPSSRRSSKAGVLPCVVATSSLELGIDMGAVDLVIQVEAPPSVASGLQRVGRAGHQVGAVSTGVVFPKYRGDLVACAVVAERMTAGAIESLRYPRNPLDVLAQHIVAMVAMEPWSLADLARSSGGRRRSPRCPSRPCTPCSTCWPGATRARSSASCARGSPGTASPTSWAAAPARSGWRSPPAARSPIAACSR